MVCLQKPSSLFCAYGHVHRKVLTSPSVPHSKLRLYLLSESLALPWEMHVAATVTDCPDELGIAFGSVRFFHFRRSLEALILRPRVTFFTFFVSSSATSSESRASSVAPSSGRKAPGLALGDSVVRWDASPIFPLAVPPPPPARRQIEPEFELRSLSSR